MMNAEFSIGLLQATLATSANACSDAAKSVAVRRSPHTQGKKVEGRVPVPVEFAPHEPTESPKAG